MAKSGEELAGFFSEFHGDALKTTAARFGLSDRAIRHRRFAVHCPISLGKDSDRPPRPFLRRRTRQRSADPIEKQAICYPGRHRDPVRRWRVGALIAHACWHSEGQGQH